MVSDLLQTCLQKSSWCSYSIYFRHSRQLLAAVRPGRVGRARGPRAEGDGHARLLHGRRLPGIRRAALTQGFRITRSVVTLTRVFCWASG